MDNDDKAAFAVCIGAMMETFGVEATKPILHGYWLGLEDLTLDQVKLAVSRAEFARKRAEEEGRSTRRREVRWFECFNHSVRMFHLTSVDEADYNARFEASKRGEFAHVA